MRVKNSPPPKEHCNFYKVFYSLVSVYNLTKQRNGGPPFQRRSASRTFHALHSIDLFPPKFTPTTAGDQRSAPTIVGVNFSFYLY